MFQFVEWLSDDHVTLKRFNGYWQQGLPYLDGITYKVAEDPTVRDTIVRTGELDITSEPDPKDVPVMAKSPGVKIVSENPSGHWYGIQWRVDRPPFNNKALRQAICYGVDRDEFVSVILGGRGTVAKGPTPSQVWWYNPGVRGYDYNPAKAKQLMAEAGYANGFSAEYSVPDTPFGLQFGQLLQAQLKRIGVNFTITPVDATDIYQETIAGKINWTETDWTLRADPDGLLRILLYTGNYANSTVIRIRRSTSARRRQRDLRSERAEADLRADRPAGDRRRPYFWIFYVGGRRSGTRPELRVDPGLRPRYRDPGFQVIGVWRYIAADSRPSCRWCCF